MKTVVIGDIHGRSIWKQIVNKENDANRVIFVGDYFDSFDIPGIDQIHNFKEISEYKEISGKDVVLLIGNHDYHYFPEIGYSGASGYQHTLAPSIMQVIDENRNHLKMAYQMGEFLFTHAGVSTMFMDSVFGKNGWKVENIVVDLNEMFKFKPKTFDFGAYLDPYRLSSPTGDDPEQSPLWIRPRSLKKYNHSTLRKQIIQVVGHTQIDKVDVNGNSTGGRYWFIDCLGTSQEYLVINDDKVIVNKI